MSETMLSLELPTLHADWSPTRVPRPDPAPGQVLVQVRACGICGTDVWITEGNSRSHPSP